MARFMEVDRYDGHFSVIADFENPGGERYIPEVITGGVDFDGEPIIRTVFGYGVRLSAPGYLDCTEWEVFETETAADERAQELEDEDTDEDTQEVK